MSAVQRFDLCQSVLLAQAAALDATEAATSPEARRAALDAVAALALVLASSDLGRVGEKAAHRVRAWSTCDISSTTRP